ncbi:MAG: AAA family ATPase [Planctomycetota bacterium]
MKVLATYNYKGGVGKTATCTTLAYLAARDGLRTLIWDLDSQGAATWTFRIQPSVGGGARSLVRGAVDLRAAVKATDYENLDVLPADTFYRKLDIALDGVEHSEDRLAELLVPFRDEYDLVLIDTAPTMSRVAESVFFAADALLAPTIPTPLSLRTLAQLFLHLKKKKSPARALPFFSLVDRRKALHRSVCRFAEEQELGFLQAEIPYSSAVERMAVRRQPLHVFAARDRAARAYRSLWEEVQERAFRAPPQTPPTRGRIRALMSEARQASG